MRHRAHTGGSDGILHGAKPHPRAYGTFPQYLGRYVRELGVLTLEECVAHLTGRPAARLRLPDRGLVREGYRADLVLFDPATVAAGRDVRAAAHPAGRYPARPDRRPVRHRGRPRTDVLAGRSVRSAGGSDPSGAVGGVGHAGRHRAAAARAAAGAARRGAAAAAPRRVAKNTARRAVTWP